MGKLISVVSGKGGVGKTTVSGGIAGALAAMDRSVLLVDGDLALGNLDITLGIDGIAHHDLIDVLNGRCPLRNAMMRISDKHPLWYLPLSLSARDVTAVHDHLPSVFSLLAERFDYVVVDSAAGIGSYVSTLNQGANLTLMVTTPDTMALRDAKRALNSMDFSTGDWRLIINRVRPELMRKGAAPDIDTIIDCVGLQLIGVLLEDSTVTPLQNAGIPLIFNAACPTGRQLWEITRRIEGHNIPLRI